jgi:DNA-binding GntR family transcriptional regulator
MNKQEWSVPTLTAAVADWIAVGIIRGSWPAGERLREIEVCEELGVSRAPVREALRELHEKGMVRLIPRIGAVVNNFSADTVIDVYEMRGVIESWICRESVPSLEKEEIDQLEVILERMTSAAADLDYPTFFSLGWNFRQTIHSGSANVVALELVDQLRARLHSLPQILRTDDAHVAATLQAYHEMFRAATAGDGVRVGEIVSQFLAGVGSRVCELFGSAADQLEATIKVRVQ